MKNIITRRIDELGRIVIPKEIRSTLKLNTGDIVEIYIDDENKVVMNKHSTILGLEVDIFNISKIINEISSASVIFADDENIITSYGKKSEIYLDKKINRKLFNNLYDYEYIYEKDFNIIDEYMEDRTMIILPLSRNNTIVGIMIVFENERLIKDYLDILLAFKKFVNKQLDS